MTNITLSYHFLHPNWYVYEIYHKLYKYLKSLQLDIEYISIEDLAKKHNETLNYRINSHLSLYNIYNLIVTNHTKDITFIHSLHDQPSAMMDHTSAIDRLNVKIFASSSNITNSLIQKYAHKFKIKPSFYILEYFDDHKFINQYYLNHKSINRCFFNGYHHSFRNKILNCLNHPFFDIRKKDTQFQSKDDYYKTLSEYRYGLSLDGIASICYRDLEYFGMNILNLRQQLHTLTIIPLEENIHYKNIINDNLLHDIVYNKQTSTDILDKIINDINSIDEEEYCFITHNAKKWFDQTVNPDQQVNILINMLHEADII